MGPSLCVVPDTTEALSTSALAAVNCSLTNVPAGHRNLTVVVDPAGGRGAALVPDALWTASPLDGTPRLFTVHGVVQGLSTKVCGVCLPCGVWPLVCGVCGVRGVWCAVVFVCLVCAWG